MMPRSLPQLVGATLLLLALDLGGCAGASTAKRPILVPLKIMSASVQVDPTSYSGRCGVTQNLTFRAALAANPSNAGGAVHYVWTIDHARSESDVIFGPGEVSKTVTRSLDYTVPADSGPELRAAIATTTPNAVSSPDMVFAIACTVEFQIVDVNVTMQPWSTDCGPHTFGWSALLTAPLNNTGGQVYYAWRFAVGPSQGGMVAFAPGQVNATVAAARSYTVVPSRLGASSAPSASTPTPAPSTSTPAPSTPTPTASTPTPQPSTPTPSPTASPWPEIAAAQIAAWLYVGSPNRISDSASLNHSSC